MVDPRNPCTRDCPDRPNCYGCVRGNEYRDLKNRETIERFQRNAFERYEKESAATVRAQQAKRRKKNIKQVTQGIR